MAGENGGLISGGYNPLEAPDAPTNVSGSAGGESIDVSFTAPSDVGGAAIQTYIAVAVDTSTDESTAAEGSSSPITITGLTNGTAYSVFVYAKNTYGYSLAGVGSGTVTPEMQPGEAYEGGFFAGQINDGGTIYNLVVAPKSSGQSDNTQWSTSIGSQGTTSVIDGPGNTATLSSATFPAANFCANLSIGGYTDWYMPAKNELEILYYNLKWSNTSNNTSSGTNTNAVPARNSNYTSGDPAQTSATAFLFSGTEALTNSSSPAGFFWSSTESNNDAFDQYFVDGQQSAQFIKTSSAPSVRAVRRVAV